MFGGKKLFYKILQGEQGVLVMDNLVGLRAGNCIHSSSPILISDSV